MLGFMLVALYAHTTSRRILALKPIFAVSPSLRQKGDLFFVTDPQICQALDVIRRGRRDSNPRSPA